MEKEEKNTKAIAITGGICTGKSFVLEELRKKQMPVFSCDEEIKKIREEDTAVKLKILEALPETKGEKEKIQKSIFEDETKRKKLENILYPELEKKRKAFLSQNKGKVVFVEIPLLYEKGKEEQYDAVIVVSCSKKTQRERAIKRGINDIVLEKIINSQLSTDEKVIKADFVIDTEGSYDETRKEIEKVFEEVKQA